MGQIMFDKMQGGPNKGFSAILSKKIQNPINKFVIPNRKERSLKPFSALLIGTITE